MITRISQVEDTPVIEEMLVAISNLLWYSLRVINALTPLGQELKVVEDYMYIQRTRSGGRIRRSVGYSQDLCERKVPVFLL